MPLLLFTDLDGSLLDHDGYSWEGARPALAEIRARAIPLILVTSKTRAEVARLQAELGLEEPYVVENGGGIVFPPRYARFHVPGAVEDGGDRLLVLGVRYAAIRHFVEEVGAGLGVRGFGDLSDEEVARLTGLPLPDAARARRRDFTEPFLLEDTGRLDELETAAGSRGLAITRGGRFHHLVGAAQDKGDAVRRVRRLFEAHGYRPALTVGLGDGPNDVPMLRSVDLPVVVPNPHGSAPRLEVPGAAEAPGPGSAGWNESVLALIARFDVEKD